MDWSFKEIVLKKLMNNGQLYFIESEVASLIHTKTTSMWFELFWKGLVIE